MEANPGKPKGHAIITSTVIVALITTIGGVIVAWINTHPPSQVATPPPIQQQTQVPTQVSFPSLHPSYIGSMTQQSNSQSFGFGMASLNEHADGSFTATGATGGCSGVVAGSIQLNNTLIFSITDYQTPNCHAYVYRFTGTLDSSGRLSGLWQGGGGSGSWAAT